MNPYEQKRRWKFLLLAFAAVIAGASLWYANYLVKNLSKAERTRAEVWAQTFHNIISMDDSNDESITFLYTLRDSLSVPAIVTDSADSILYWKGLDSTKTAFAIEAGGVESAIFNKKEYDPKYFLQQLKTMKSQHPPIVIELANREKRYIYYKDSSLLTQLRVFPYIQLTVIGIFLIVAYLVFSSSRRTEQDLVWVGMAKETAHQLGTPISSLMAWIELVKSKFDAEDEPLIVEMEKDLHRLEMVADRFSKIGSKAVLKSYSVFEIIKAYVDYFRIRTSEKIEFVVGGDKGIPALLNVPLFDWVLENLLKNAVNAIQGHGKIEVKITESPSKEEVFIDVCDSGKGIPRFKFETIFQPGYTTRKRGWGLGLSLTKRIVENYHKGQIFVKDSEPGKGTTIRIILKNVNYTTSS